jgi:hypothetical protein
MNIRMPLDKYNHRIRDLSLVQWRLINLGYGIKHESAELLVQHLLKVKANFESFFFRKNLEVVRLSTSLVPDAPSRICRFCKPNDDFSVAAAPYKCEYTVSEEVGGDLDRDNIATNYASTWNVNSHLDGCKSLETVFYTEEWGW